MHARRMCGDTIGRYAVHCCGTEIKLKLISHYKFPVKVKVKERKYLFFNIIHFPIEISSTVTKMFGKCVLTYMTILLGTTVPKNKKCVYLGTFLQM